MTEIAGGVFVHNGVHEEASAANEDAIANIGFIVGAAGVAVIDPGGSYAEGSALRAAIRARTDRPIQAVMRLPIRPVLPAALTTVSPALAGAAKPTVA